MKNRLIVLLAASLVAMSASAAAASSTPGSHALPSARVQLAPDLSASDVNTIAGGLDAFVTWTDNLFLNATSSSGAELLEQRLPLIGTQLNAVVKLPDLLSSFAALPTNYSGDGAEAAFVQDLADISGVSSVATTSDGTIHLVFSTSSDPVVVAADDDFGIEGQRLLLSPADDSKIRLSASLSLDLTFGATTSEFCPEEVSSPTRASSASTVYHPPSSLRLALSRRVRCSPRHSASSTSAPRSGRRQWTSAMGAASEGSQLTPKIAPPEEPSSR